MWMQILLPRTRRQAIVFLAALLPLMVTRPTRAAITFNDVVFNPVDWSDTVLARDPGATETVQQDTVGGNPGAFRHMMHQLPPSTAIDVFHEFLPASYNPAATGAITRIDYSEDQIEFNPPFAGAKIRSAPALIQGGIVYIGPANDYGNTTWQTHALPNLAAIDFTEFAGSTHPNFSASGAPIHFGFFRFNAQTGSFPIVADHGIDNWSITVVPEPSTLCLIVSSMFCLGRSHRRHFTGASRFKCRRATSC
jgi:hypothetical protein